MKRSEHEYLQVRVNHQSCSHLQQAWYGTFPTNSFKIYNVKAVYSCTHSQKIVETDLSLQLAEGADRARCAVIWWLEAGSKEP